MPTLKPRVTITMEPFTHEAISRLASLQGRTRGAVIAELLDSIAPSLTRTVALLEAAMEAPEQIKAGLRGVVESLQDELSSVAGDASAQLDMLMDRVGEDAPNPRLVTRGSGIGPDGGRKPSKSRAKRSSSGV